MTRSLRTARCNSEYHRGLEERASLQPALIALNLDIFMLLRRLIGPTLITLVMIGLWLDYLFFRDSRWSPINFLSKVFVVLGKIFVPFFNPAVYVAQCSDRARGDNCMWHHIALRRYHHG
jgi:hypothetical protein